MFEQFLPLHDRGLPRFALGFDSAVLRQLTDLQASPRYPGGLALRLARVKRYRDDKRAEEADTMEAIRKIYAAQQ